MWLAIIYAMCLVLIEICYLRKDDIRQLCKRLWKIIKPFLSWKLLICYLPFWFLFTGWSYIAIAVGKGLLKKIAIGYLTFMYMPFSEEKLITIPLTIWLYKKLFYKSIDQKDLDSLNEMLDIGKKNRELN